MNSFEYRIFHDEDKASFGPLGINPASHQDKKGYEYGEMEKSLRLYYAGVFGDPPYRGERVNVTRVDVSLKDGVRITLETNMPRNEVTASLRRFTECLKTIDNRNPSFCLVVEECMALQACHLRAIEMVRMNFGSIRDLPKQVWPVIWVSTYRSCETAMKVEAIGGSNPIVKGMLLGNGQDIHEFENSIRKIEFLKKFVPLIRQATSERERADASSLLIDVLKWNITDAGEMSMLRRIIARQFANADPLYAYPIPDDVP